MRRSVLCLRSPKWIFLAGLLWVAIAMVARADIYQWQWVNPSDPSQGKIPSSTLCPGGAGVSPAPYVDLSSRNLTQGYLIGANFGEEA